MTTTLLLLGLKSVLVTALALAALRLTRRRSAAERSTIAHLGLFALVALPLASLALPAFPLELPSPLAQQLAPVPQSGASDFLSTPEAPVTVAAVKPAFAHGAVTAADPAWRFSDYAAPLARIAYVLPALALLVLTGVALIRLVLLRARAQVLVEPHWIGALARAQRRMGFKNGTALLSSADLQSPVSWGFLRPTIVVNESALGAEGQAEAIIAHELAHVIQFDWAKLMLARVATAVFWFNPLAWLLAREAHQLREEAADDAVLAANIAGTDYAELLIGIARHENNVLLLGAHGVAPSRDSLRRRVTRVLDSASARGPSGRSWVAGFTAGMMVMAAPLAALTLGPARASDVAVSATPLVQTGRAPALGPIGRSIEADALAPMSVMPSPLTPVARHHGAPDAGKAMAAGFDAVPASSGSDAEHADIPYLSASISDLAELGAQFGERYAQAGKQFGRAIAAQVMQNVTAPSSANAPQPRYFGHDDGDGGDADQDGEVAARDRSDAMFGVTEAYRKDIAGAGFPDASSRDLLIARSVWLDGDTIRDMRAAGIDGPLETFVQARSVGLNADYIKGMRAAGISATVQDYIRARNIGLTPDYVRGMRDAGIVGSLNDYIHAKATGLSVAYIGGLKALGVSGSFKDYWELRAAGVTTGFVTSLARQGYDVRSPAKLIEMRTLGYKRRTPQPDDDG
jgi:beta-lactamase regulating signal transducer with metallopeptidase domain